MLTQDLTNPWELPSSSTECPQGWLGTDWGPYRGDSEIPIPTAFSPAARPWEECDCS